MSVWRSVEPITTPAHDYVKSWQEDRVVSCSGTGSSGWSNLPSQHKDGALHPHPTPLFWPLSLCTLTLADLKGPDPALNPALLSQRPWWARISCDELVAMCVLGSGWQRSGREGRRVTFQPLKSAPLSIPAVSISSAPHGGSQPGRFYIWVSPNAAPLSRPSPPSRKKVPGDGSSSIRDNCLIRRK